MVKWSVRVAGVSVFLMIIFSSLSLVDDLLGEADGSGSQAATFDEVIVEISPFVQGYGGEIEVTLRAFFYGGCCYSLFANDITPSIQIGEGLSVVSGPTPSVVDEVTAVAGGEPTITTFRWTLQCDDPGSFYINCTVETSDCGIRETSGIAHVIKGASISKPAIYPKNPISDKETSLIFESSYSVGEIEIVDAVICHYSSDSEMELAPENETLYMGDEEIQGVGKVQCRLDEVFPERFTGSIPPTEKRYVYYWIVVTDENGNTTTSSIYDFEVENVGRVDRLNGISFIFLFVSTLLLILILIGGQNVFRKFINSPEEGDNFNVLGPVGRKRYPPPFEQKGKRMKADTVLPYVIVGSIIVISLIAVIYSVITGDAAELFQHLLDGK